MKTIYEALAELSESLNMMASKSYETAKEHAFDMLDGRVDKAEIKANKAKAKSEAYKLAAEKVEDLIHFVNKGTINLKK
jgi:predicted Zn-dependent protease